MKQTNLTTKPVRNHNNTISKSTLSGLHINTSSKSSLSGLHINTSSESSLKGLCTTRKSTLSGLHINTSSESSLKGLCIITWGIAPRAYTILMLHAILTILLLLPSCSSNKNPEYEEIIIEKDKTTFTTKEKPQKVIFLIGDGMGLTHITAASIAHKKPLALEQFKHIGLVKTHSLKLITDSAAGATAMATGSKTYNGAISVDKNQKKLKTILEYAEEHNWLTGIITTATVTHATPACFYGHQPTRSKVNKQLAAEFMTKNIEVLMGGGWNYFKEGIDGRDLLLEAQEKGYFVTNNIEQVGEYCPNKMICLISPELPPRLAERGNFLPLATQKAIEILNYNHHSNFFLMVEGAQIDWGGHENKSDYIIEEMFDFDKAIAQALAYAKKDGNTLVIVTADHETGGYSINGEKDDVLDCKFTTDYHTGTMVPIFAYGPGAESFTGIMDNTEIFHKLKHLMGFE